MVMTSGSGRLRLARDDSAPTSHVLVGALLVYLGSGGVRRLDLALLQDLAHDLVRRRLALDLG